MKISAYSTSYIITRMFFEGESSIVIMREDLKTSELSLRLVQSLFETFFCCGILSE